jgi:4-hydroxythreonine-4-phosphate dehydrogenase
MSSKRNPISRSSRIRVGITIGDPSGIGPLITRDAVKSLKGEADFVIIGDPLSIDAKVFPPGKANASSGLASVKYIDAGISMIKKKEIDCLVTCPVSKEAINLAGIEFKGHTEYLADAFGVKNCVMMLLNSSLRFSLLTRHVPLSRVSGALNRRQIGLDSRITCRYLKNLFGISKPRLVFCGINPHASDNGIIGEEEDRIVMPVVKSLKKLRSISVEGPVSADIAVLRAYRGEFDCVMAAYHDQALIPLKLSGGDTGVNITLGLPFVRTSPLHGTAFDIALKPEKARPDSLISAIRLAIKCASFRRKA